MKSLKIALIVLVSLSIFGVSCKKEEVPLTQNKVTNTQNHEIKIKDGMLQFDNMDAFYNAIGYLGSLNSEERKKWGESKGIKTQQMIIDELIQTQILFENIRYANLNEEISIVEMNKLGLNPEWCPEIKEYELSGLLKTKEEEDGSISFEASSVMFGTTPVINEKGFVLISNKLYLYKDDKIKIMKYESEESKSELTSAINTDLANDVHVFSFGNSKEVSNEKHRMIGNIFDMNYNGKIWYHPSTKERFEHYIVMYSYEQKYYGNPVALDYNNIFLTRANAEQWRFGSWMRRSTYKPIRRLSGSWNWTLYAYQPSLVLTYAPYGPAYGPVHSPLFVTTPFSNDLYRTLYPTGKYLLDHIPLESVNYFDFNIYGSFAGGSSGYTTHYHL